MLALLLLAAAPAAVEVPFEVEDVRAYVPVTAQGRTAWMVLDDGVWNVVLDTGTAEALGVRTGEASTISGVGAGSTTRRWGSAVTLQVGPVPLEVASPAVIPLDATLSPYTGRRAPGIIGAPFFLAHAVRLDFGKGVMTVSPPGSATPARGAVEVPLEVEGGAPYARATVRTAAGEEVALRVLVDLGAKATLLVSEPFLARSGLAARAGPRVQSPLGAGVGGETRYDFVRLARLAVGGAALEQPVAGLSVRGTLRGSDYDALLGLGFLQRFTVTLDLAARKMWLEPPAVGPPPEAFDGSGLYLTAHGPALRDLKVHEVAAGSPGARAGLAVGDALLAVDGAPVAGLTLSAVRERLSGPPGTRVALRVKRGQAARDVALTLERRL